MSNSITSEKIRIDDARLSFPQLFRPKSFQQGQEPRYQATFLLDPTNPAHKETIRKILEESKRLACEAFKLKPPPDQKLSEFIGWAMAQGVKGFAIFNGNTKADQETYGAYRDKWAVTSSNTVPPTIVNRNRQNVAEGSKEAPYAGCFVNGSITLWTQNNSFGKRVNANLRAVQFCRDGEAFGRGPVDADDEFEVLGDAPVAPSAGGDDF